MANWYASAIGNDSWDGTSGTFVSGTTGPKLTIRAAMALVAANNDTVSGRSGDTFTETAGTNGVIEFPAAYTGITVGTYGGTARAVVACPIRTLSITVVVTGATTVLTSVAHGRAAGQWVSGFSGFTAGGVTGLDGQAINITATTADTITVPIDTSGVYTSGGVMSLWEHQKFCVYNAGSNNATLSNWEVMNGNHGVRMPAPSASTTTGFLVTGCYVHHNNQHGISSQDTVGTGESTITVANTVLAYNRNDHVNAQGNTSVPSQGWVKTIAHDNTISYGGFDSDGVASYYTPTGTSARSADSGGGDGYTQHGYCYGDYYASTITYCGQSGVAFVNTNNTSRVWNLLISEVSGQGITQTSGGAITIFGCMVISPVVSTPNTKTTGKGNITLSGAGAGLVYNNTSVTTTGAANTALVTTNVHGFAFKSHTGTLTYKNNATISNGTAPLICVSLSGQTNFVSGNNYYSHTTALFLTTNNSQLISFATWQTKTIGGATLDTTAPQTGGTNIVGGSAPTDAAGFMPLKTGLLFLNGADLSGVGITELLTDYNGRSRVAASWTIGALVAASISGGGYGYAAADGAGGGSGYRYQN